MCDFWLRGKRRIYRFLNDTVQLVDVFVCTGTSIVKRTKSARSRFLSSGILSCLFVMKCRTDSKSRSSGTAAIWIPMVSTDTGKPATWSAPQHIVMLRSGQFSNRIKNEAVQCGTVSFFIILAESPWSALDVASSYYSNFQ